MLLQHRAGTARVEKSTEYYENTEEVGKAQRLACRRKMSGNASQRREGSKENLKNTRESTRQGRKGCVCVCVCVKGGRHGYRDQLQVEGTESAKGTVARKKNTADSESSR